MRIALPHTPDTSTRCSRQAATPDWKCRARRTIAERGFGLQSTAGVPLVRPDGEFTSFARKALHDSLFEMMIGQSAEEYIRLGPRPSFTSYDAFVTIGFHTNVAIPKAMKILRAFDAELNRTLIGRNHWKAKEAQRAFYYGVFEQVGDKRDVHLIVRLPPGESELKKPWKLKLFLERWYSERYPAATVDVDGILGKHPDARVHEAMATISYGLKSRHPEPAGGIIDRFFVSTEFHRSK